MSKLFDAFYDMCEAYNEEKKKQEAEKEALRENFETEEKKYNRGTVISAMAEHGYDSFDMNRILEKVTNSERAEAAVGLIRSKKYDAWDIGRILEKI